MSRRGSRVRVAFGSSSLRKSRRSRCRRQDGGCCCGCLFHRAGMMVLMSRQRSATGKSLLAVCVWAFIWSFSGVNATVSGKRAGVAERLIPRPSASFRRACPQGFVLYCTAHTCGVSRRYELERARSAPTFG